MRTEYGIVNGSVFINSIEKTLLLIIGNSL